MYFPVVDKMTEFEGGRGVSVRHTHTLESYDHWVMLYTYSEHCLWWPVC